MYTRSYRFSEQEMSNIRYLWTNVTGLSGDRYDDDKFTEWFNKHKPTLEFLHKELRNRMTDLYDTHDSNIVKLIKDN